MEVIEMPERRKQYRANRGKTASSVIPQGKSADTEFGNEPKSVLEDRAKKRNTRS
jgi:small acid-soluble spore protein L (minor)